MKSDDQAVVELKRIIETELYYPCTFMYANLAEANFGLDSVDTPEDKPVFVLLANEEPVKNKTTESGLIIRAIPVAGMFLQTVDSAGNEISSEVAAPYIAAMQRLLDNLIFRLNKSTYTYQLEPISEYSFQKIHDRFDKSLVGGGSQFVWNFNTGKRGC